jgi:hypothetical protein
MRRLAFPVLCIVLLPLCAAAQSERDTAYVMNVSPAIGIHYGMPLRLSIAAGGLFDMRGRRNDGIIAMVEQGQGGTEISLGYFQRHRFGQGFSLRLAGVRTREEAWNASERTSYLGAEAHWMLLAGVGGRAGWLRRVSGKSGQGLDDNVWTLGISIGD